MEHLKDIAIFASVVEQGGFTAAADQLEISKAAVSKYVGRLEQRLGARLLNRTTRRVTLTEAGEALYRRCVIALSDLEEAENEVMQLSGAPRGHLRVSVPVYFGEMYLAPHLNTFRRRYPEVQLDLDFDNRIVDLVKERFDVAIRITQLGDSSLVARRIADCPLAVCAAPKYVALHGKPATPAQLREHDCLSYSLERTPNEWRFRKPGGRWIPIAVKGSIRCNNDIALKQAVIDGMGIRLLPRMFIEHELQRGVLIELLNDYELPPLKLYAVFPSRKNLLPKARVFIEFLDETFGNKKNI